MTTLTEAAQGADVAAVEQVEKSLRIADKRGEPYVCATVELRREALREVLAMAGEATALRARVAELEAEVRDLKEPRLREMHIEDGAIEMTIEDATGVVHRMALAMCKMLDDSGAENYLQQEVSVSAREYVLLVQRRNGKTPNALRREAEAERDSLRAQLDASEALVDALTEQHKQDVEASMRLEGLKPEFPPMPPNGRGLPRYGLRWPPPANSAPLAVPMDDGYWTPWHLADAARNELREAAQNAMARCKYGCTVESYCGRCEPLALVLWVKP